jgi:hypothetical protein
MSVPMIVSLVGRMASRWSSLPWLPASVDVLGLLHQELFGYEQREVPVLVAARLDHVVEGPLDPLPDRVAVGPDDHAAADRRVVGQLRLPHHVGVPAVEVLGHPRDVFHIVKSLCHRWGSPGVD